MKWSPTGWGKILTPACPSKFFDGVDFENKKQIKKEVERQSYAAPLNERVTA